MSHSWVVRFIVAGLASALVGCSIHPLPEDVSRVSTFDIVEKLRCEAKEGILGLPSSDPFYTSIVHSTVIGYDFEFEITEDNNLRGSESDPAKLSFARAAKADGKGFFLDITGAATRTRSNKRVFRILEYLKDLPNCSAAMQANWVYPITGRVGIDEVISTYIRLEALTDIRAKDPEGGPKLDNKSIIFSDELKFATVLNAGIKPTLELSTVVGRFKVTNATLFAQAKREDKHNVTIALARDTSVDLDPRRAGPRAFAGAQRRAEVLKRAGPAVARDPRALAALAQKELLAPDRVLLELERRRILREDETLNVKLLETLKLVP